MSKAYLFSICCFLLFLHACSSDAPQEGNKDVALAQVFSKQLLLSELDGLVPRGTSHQDSAVIVNGYINRWIKDQVMLHEAERHLSKELDIDQLVRDYRASLIRNNYEKILVEMELDSIVSDVEFSNYYEENKAQFQLDGKIARCYFMKVDSNSPGLSQAKQWWSTENETNFENLISFAKNNANKFLLKDSSWYNINKLIGLMPKDLIPAQKLKTDFSIVKNDEQYHYFLKVLEIKSKGSLAPKSFVKDQVNRVILHKRKLALLDQKKDEIYDREARKNNIKIFNQ